MKIRAFDFESRRIDRGEDLAPQPVCVTWCDSSLEPGILHARDALELLRDTFTNYTVVGANVAFDCAIVTRWYPELTPLVFATYSESRVLDIQLAQQLIDLGMGELGGYKTAHDVSVKHSYSLASLYERYGLGVMDKSGDTWRLRYGELIDTPVSEWPEAARSYALLDAKATYQIYHLQQQFAEFLEDTAAQTRKALALQYMSIRGMVTDPDTCREYLAETHKHLEDCRKLLLEHGLLRGEVDPETGKKNPKSKVGSKDTKAAKMRMVQVCAQLGVDVKRTAKDGVCLDQEATRDSGDEVLQAYSTFTSSDTIIKKVTKLQEGSKGLPLQTSFDVLKANGRCSSREPSPPLIGVQSQNLPKRGRMRNCFVARPGYALVSIDFNMHELVTVAQVQIWLKASHRLADALNAGRDVHCEVGTQLLGCSYEEIVANRKIKGSKYQLARNQSKEINFGGWGVMTANRLMLQMNKKREKDDPIVSEDRAAEIMRAWETQYEPHLYFEKVGAMFPEHNRWGRATLRQFISNRVRAHLSFPDACNTLFSGLAADASAAAAWEVTKACKLARRGDPLFDCHPVLVVHDEILLEVPLATLHASAYAACNLFVGTAQQYTPDVKLGAAPAAALFYDKDVDTVLVNGELQLWQKPKA